MNLKTKKFSKTVKGGINLSIRTVTMIALGIMIIAMMYLAFENAVESLIGNFLDSLGDPTN